jgi:PAS domain S-box-containing protein
MHIEPELSGDGAPRQASDGTTATDEDLLLLEVLRQARLAVWAADDRTAGFTISLWNSGAEQIYGFSRDEAVGSSYIDLFVNPAEQHKAIEDHERIVRTGQEFSWNFAADDLTKDGSVRTILGNSFRVWDARQKKYVLAEVGIDISGFDRSASQIGRERELSLLQGDVRRSLQTLRAMNLVNDAMTTLTAPDTGGLRRIAVAVSHAVREMVGGESKCRLWLIGDMQGPRLAQGSDDLQLPPVVNERHLVDEVVAREAGGESIEAVLVDLHAARGIPDAADTFVAVPLPFAGQLVGILLVFFSAPERLNSSALQLLQVLGSQAGVGVAMARLAGELNERRREDAQRTRQAVIQSVLHTVGNEAGKAQLAANQLSEDLQGAVVPAQARNNIERVNAAATRLGQILGELAQMGEQASQPVLLKVDEAVRAVTRTVERDHFHSIEIRHVLEPDLTVQASEYLFREVLGQIVGNAVNSMIEADGGGDIEISARGALRADDHRIVQIDVEDSGPGVTTEYLDRIWDYGFSTRGGGHGHGLSQTRSMVAMLGGEVSLIRSPSALGGAHFRIVLPTGPG